MSAHDKLIEGMDRDERALEKAANALDRLSTIAEKFYAKLYPERHAREAIVTTVRTAEQAELDETLQGSERTISDWKEIGPREQAFLEEEKSKKPKS